MATPPLSTTAPHHFLSTRLLSTKQFSFVSDFSSIVPPSPAGFPIHRSLPLSYLTSTERNKDALCRKERRVGSFVPLFVPLFLHFSHLHIISLIKPLFPDYRAPS